MADGQSLVRLFQSPSKTKIQRIGELATLKHAAGMTFTSLQRRCLRAAIRHTESLEQIIDSSRFYQDGVRQDQALYIIEQAAHSMKSDIIQITSSNNLSACASRPELLQREAVLFHKVCERLAYHYEVAEAAMKKIT
jgi:hypothetical protein